jgi:tetratricopeptide (TPR) repeat protein
MTSLASWVIKLSLIVWAASAGPKTDSREEAARGFFAAAKYQEAIDLYSQLFAKYLHPDYIYNIGRCYQNMGDPDKALQSFHEFERKTKNLPPDMRKELAAHIKEMEALKAQRDALNGKLAATADDEPEERAPSPAKPAEKPTRPAVNSAPEKSKAVLPAQGKADPLADTVIADRFLEQMRTSPEKFWRERALEVDEAKLAKTAGMVKNAKAGDPRLAEYNLHLATQFAGKHFSLRLRELESKSDSGRDSHKVTTGERKLGPEISATFSSAAGYYVAATDRKDFPKMDEALMGLAVLLEANNMESRARKLLLQLLRNFPQSKQSEAVKSAGQAQ